MRLEGGPLEGDDISGIMNAISPRLDLGQQSGRPLRTRLALFTRQPGKAGLTPHPRQSLISGDARKTLFPPFTGGTGRTIRAVAQGSAADIDGVEGLVELGRLAIVPRLKKCPVGQHLVAHGHDRLGNPVGGGVNEGFERVLL